MRALEDMKELLTEQVKQICRKGDAISPQELDNAYKAVDIIKDIETISAMKRAEEERGEMSMQSRASNHYPYWEEESYAGGSNASRASNASRDSEESYRRGRSPITGRYVSRDGSYDGSYDSYEGSSNRSYGRGSYERGYSSADEKEELKKTLDEMKQKIDKMK